MTKSQKLLVVDASKIVRVSLAKCLKGQFEIIEESDGESAWQTLVLDSSVTAVISGRDLAVLNGMELLERIRENRLCRLNRMPFLMLVSDSFSEAEQQEASRHGVTGFIRKGMAAPEIVSMIRRFVGQVPLSLTAKKPEASAVCCGEHSLIGASDVLGEISGLARLQDAAVAHKSPGKDESCLLDRQGVTQCLQELLAGEERPKSIGLMYFGVDGFDSLVECHGQALAQKVTQKLSRLIMTKLRRGDSIGQFATGRIVVIAPHTDTALCIAFANRVCKALAGAQIALRGQALNLTLSVGIAAVPDDGSQMRGEELLGLAAARLEAAMRTGGNRVLPAISNHPVAAPGPRQFVARMRDLVASATPEVIANCAGSAGLEILPLLATIERQLHLGLQIEDIGKRLSELAQNEHLSI
jgi:diguanylate cyclase (GGDEF)-like protein